METLSSEELRALVERVFQPRPEDRSLALLVDLPDSELPDNPTWKERRQIAFSWLEQLRAAGGEISCELLLYRNVRANNADLPASAWTHRAGAIPDNADALDPADAEPFEQIFRRVPLFIALTELSATAPLKLASRERGFRAATMPGFTASMVPALRLDYGEIDRRVQHLKQLLDRAMRADLHFAQADTGEEWTLALDLRHREAHASGGLLRRPGTAGNLPSGETYIVPYEGERDGDPSGSAGTLPVQFAEEIVRYRIEGNRALAADGEGSAARKEAERLRSEPAYGNIAELGFGVLADFGLQPIGELLLDEKLGLHVAFGRSDHFGGQVGAAQFSSPEAVVHIDRVYLPATQPLVKVPSVTLQLEGGETLTLMKDGRYAIDF